MARPASRSSASKIIVRFGDELPPIPAWWCATAAPLLYPRRSSGSINSVTRLSLDRQPALVQPPRRQCCYWALDHQIIGITGRRIVRVNDVQVAQVSVYRIVSVDVNPQRCCAAGVRSWSDRIVGRQIIG
jgi:hypothetical protein